MRADIGALVEIELVGKTEDPPLRVHGGAREMMLLPRVVGCDEMLTPVFDPLHRSAEPLAGDAEQEVLGIEFPRMPKPPADMAFVEWTVRSRPIAKARQGVAVSIGTFAAPQSSRMSYAAVVTSDRPAAFHGHSRYGDRSRDRPRRCECAARKARSMSPYSWRRTSASLLRPGANSAAGRRRIEPHGKGSSSSDHEFGGILGEVRRSWLNTSGDRFAHVPDSSLGEQRLAMTVKCLGRASRKSIGGNVGDVGMRSRWRRRPGSSRAVAVSTEQLSCRP